METLDQGCWEKDTKDIITKKLTTRPEPALRHHAAEDFDEIDTRSHVTDSVTALSKSRTLHSTCCMSRPYSLRA